MATNWDNLFTYDTLVHACSGAAGSITAMTVFYPLDIVRSRIQVETDREAKGTLSMMQDLIRDEGVHSLYRGLKPVLISVCASNFVYFYTFHGLRAVFNAGDSRKNSMLKDLALGAVAGAVNVFVTTPLWVANTRLKLQGAQLKQSSTSFPSSERPSDRNEESRNIRRLQYDGILDALLHISRQEGLGALWASALPSLVLVSNPSIQFMIYEYLKREATRLIFGDASVQEPLSGRMIFLLGAMAKSVSTVLTYPLQIVQTKQRYGSADAQRKNMIQLLQHMIEREGAAGCYKGLEAKLLQTVLTTSLMFLCYEKIVAFVFLFLGRNQSIKRSH